jgi:hypothetical protein
MANTTGQKHGGRKKGTPNRLTKELRSVLKEVVYNELENIEEQLDQLEPKQRLELVVKLMPFVFPKMESASHTINEPLDWGIE